MVPTGSMLNTILIGDFMLVNKFVYGVKLPFTDKTIIPVSSPKRGDIIVFRFPVDTDDPQPPERYTRLFPRWLPLLPLFWDNRTRFFTWYVPRNFIKRCIAVAGDTVEYRDKQLYVNGRLQTEPYVMHTDAQTLPGIRHHAPQAAFQKAWEERRFYESDYSAYVRDQFGPVVVPAGIHLRDGRQPRQFRGRPVLGAARPALPARQAARTLLLFRRGAEHRPHDHLAVGHPV